MPFYLIKDSKGNDVIYINDNNMIYTNTMNNDIGRQLTLFTKCLNMNVTRRERLFITNIFHDNSKDFKN